MQRVLPKNPHWMNFIAHPGNSTLISKVRLYSLCMKRLFLLVQKESRNVLACSSSHLIDTKCTDQTRFLVYVCVFNRLQKGSGVLLLYERIYLAPVPKMQSRCQQTDAYCSEEPLQRCWINALTFTLNGWLQYL